MVLEVNTALRNNEKDNVATVFGSDTKRGSAVEVSDPKGEKMIVKSLDIIPFGHKIAISDIPESVHVCKYGEEIGIATKDIKKGEHVHVHNIESMRGRGDWNQEGGSSR